jgi:hypothetical protein
LVAAAALGHLFFGDLHLDVAAAIVVGSVPGVLLGARLSSRAPGGVVRAALVVVLVASATKLLGAPNWATLAAAVVSLAVAVPTLARTRETPASPVEPKLTTAGTVTDRG